MAPTAFVSHPDCARHDTGWKHPDHQGRLPALVRAVYRDMLTLHGSLLEVEAVPATEEELLLVHTEEHLAAIRAASHRAASTGAVQRLEGEVFVSGASWDAARAAAGTAITGAREVLEGRARNSFCAARPPGQGASQAGFDGFSLVNNAAIAARWLRENGVSRVLLAEWDGIGSSASPQVLAGDSGVFVLTVGALRDPVASHPGSRGIGLPDGASGTLFRNAFEAAIDDLLGTWSPEFILLSAGFEILAGDPIGRLSVFPSDIHALTQSLRERAESTCGGRLVSILEGGYDQTSLGEATVEHLRALSGNPARDPTG